MSGIGSVSSYLSQAEYLSALNTSSVSQLQEQQNTIREKMDAKLDEALDAAGLDDQTQESLKADLDQALEALFSDNSSRSDPDKVKQTVDSVLKQYGLNGNDVFGQIRPPGGPPPGKGSPPSTGGGLLGQTDTEETSETTLLEILLAQLNESSESDSDLTPQEFAQRLTDALIGFDEEA